MTAEPHSPFVSESMAVVNLFAAIGLLRVLCCIFHIIFVVLF